MISQRVSHCTNVLWFDLGARNGLEIEVAWGSNFHIPLRMLTWANKQLSARNDESAPSVASSPARSGNRTGKARSVLKTLFALAAYPMERVCQTIPIITLTDLIAIIQKTERV